MPEKENVNENITGMSGNTSTIGALFLSHAEGRAVGKR